MKIFNILAPLGLSLLLTACAMGPDYKKPETIQNKMDFQGEGEFSELSIAQLKWRNLYKDPALAALIDQALLNNLDLKIAAERMYRSANNITVTDADLLPQFEAEFFHDKEKLSRQFSDSDNIIDEHRLLGRVSWEVDLWGKLRRNSEAALATYQADQADYYGAKISLIAEVANKYYQIQDIKEQIKLTNSNVVAREKSKRIAELRHQQGVISGLDVTQSHVELVKEKLKLPSLKNALNSAMYSLSILVGEAPNQMDIADRESDTKIYYDSLKGGLSSHLLKRRPDIVSQERKLHAATARIGSAQTEYFPNITLNAYYGGKSSELDDILNNADTWLFGVEATMPLFNWGKTEALIDDLESEYREAVSNYQKVVLNAFKETAEAFEAFEQTQLEYELKGELLVATQENMRIAQLRYKNGSINYIDVLDAQRSLADAEADYSSAINNHQSAFINLYKTLGGGWDAEVFDSQIQKHIQNEDEQTLQTSAALAQ